ncbi:hypothetical protein [Kribbella sp. NPDC051718]|uniref:hypothetical protein n=1 Tax=Kribbella sp. NPDC051718 TaxID=3155168 RepID=UPI0034332DAC
MEGNWSASVRDVRSVDPVLSALQDGRRAHHARRHINDPDDLALSLKQWGQRQHDGFNIGYIALTAAQAPFTSAGGLSTSINSANYFLGPL